MSGPPGQTGQDRTGQEVAVVDGKTVQEGSPSDRKAMCGQSDKHREIKNFDISYMYS